MMERFRVGDLVWATILEILPNGFLLKLDEETRGFLPLSESGEEGADVSAREFALGTELLVKVIGYDRLGRPLLSLGRVTEADREEAEFHREALVFRALLSHRVVPLTEKPEAGERVEWRLGRWLHQAESVLRQRKERPPRAVFEEEKE